MAELVVAKSIMSTTCLGLGPSNAMNCYGSLHCTAANYSEFGNGWVTFSSSEGNKIFVGYIRRMPVYLCYTSTTRNLKRKA